MSRHAWRSSRGAGPLRAGLQARVPRENAQPDFGVLTTLLRDPSVTDVLVNGPYEVWVDRGGGLERTDVSMADEFELRRLAQSLAAVAGRRLDDSQPWVDALVGASVRVHAVLPPLAAPGTCLSLRVHPSRPMALHDLVADGTVPEEAAAVLREIVATAATFVVTGATGAGKTTLLQALLGLVPATERLLVVEEAPELAPDHPHAVGLSGRPPNVEGSGAVTLRDLVRQALRMRPDRLVLGEARGAEVVDLLAALNTGHSGAITLHAGGAGEVASRFVALGALAGLAPDAMDRLVAASVEVVVHLARRRAGQRSVVEICRVLAGPGGPRMSPVWRA